MRVLLAFDKFKDSLRAEEACGLAAESLAGQHPGWEIDSCPLSDGGEGFVEILTAAAGGELCVAPVTGPRGGSIPARFGIVAAEQIPAAARHSLGIDIPAGSRIGVVEMAAASGLALLPPERRDVWHTTTSGTGELLRAAADRGVAAIVLGVGGSATSDLGLGALAALGLKLESNDGQEIDAPKPASWPAVARFRGELAPLPPVFIACDVTNPLLGRRGAAAVYGPQKGLLAEDVARFDHEAARIALLLCSHFKQPDKLMETPGAGAAGGISFGLMVATGARLLPGFDFVSRWLDLDTRIAGADIVLTGEGCFDDSSLTGKGPGAVAWRALQQNKSVHIFAGSLQVQSTRSDLSLHAITPPGMSLDQALREAKQNLTAAVQQALAGL